MKPDAATSPARPSGFPIAIPFPEWLGARIASHSPDRIRVELPLDANMVNSRGMAHGGVVMTLLDVAMALAAREAPTSEASPVRSTATIEMKTTFLRPGSGRLVADAHCIQRSGSMAFCEGEVVDAAGTRVARASATFKFLQAGRGEP